MPVVDAAWQEWLHTNAARGCTMDSMIEAMVQAGFAVDAASEAVRGAFGLSASATSAAATSAASAGGTEAALPQAAQKARAAYQYDEGPVARGNTIRAFDHDVQVLMRCDRPQVIVFANVLSPEECNEMIERSRHRLKRSTIVDPATGQEDVIRNRTSEGIWYQRAEDAFIERLDQRIASLMNWPVENGEGLQILLHYGPTGEYRPHFDYFPLDQPGSAVHTARGGQRVATLVVYLNDVADGGETIFPEAGLSVAAKQGGAVYFRYMNGQRQLDPLTLHGGAPVRAGDKWTMTKWMRERAYV
ncbi:MAG: Similar to eukaryotic Peptidyl prolyl 4-hydroxylase, alpha subunit (EC [uncultured Paraburkholderia sp.]|nr:MAG: Similar to eukaryotic Peptidyl prolyl 4-hydroxylase, alpha subunit (EC [uncultured Paraburkholderia sp.]CAH2929509.1 MAG: Similar to eukaryotic Peptidyl prolyl 4-hydroxylase, alpha subunit (EC [uncultured Paraburkholderia sp.]